MKIQSSHNEREIDMMSTCKYLHNFPHCDVMLLMMEGGGGSTKRKIRMWKWKIKNERQLTHLFELSLMFAQRQNQIE
jgi:hypothetical protein